MSYRQKAGGNIAHMDQIWKDHIEREKIAGNLWPKNWGFLSCEYKKINFKYSQLHSPRKAAEKIKHDTETLKLPPLAPANVSKSLPFPTTTSKEIGWRAANRSYHVDIYGPYARPKGELVKLLKWPPEAIN
ncbi:ciliary microtubule inner protein 1-like [Oscarella lobularis]|uniref:ciliary microtubule inner protein 1-like n=1 Tax=Oscarella lobularis TaxID=121494 RepID=UPI003313B659